ncbi:MULTISPECIES: sarcosine oxidase subunit gamma family protein [unclassified Aureimonas]|uniref:sarcosine oxidase subunit gamma family protein n=1 Tax=unclassified Aureimonas TaxID=2615206 RepID=UPI0006FBD411|nr:MULTISPECIES: sarcosine oxidase subunit gamma family protein [unclassified Aureimonas]KQT64007.1 hypothetical protein ASG62_03035 [Aureimonas sp. Leaf427]KQT81200.1 hypothetical protein ASG54_00305 [Aureimonas sp. Leaf460]
MSEIASRRIAPRPALPQAPLGGPGSALVLAALPEGHVLQALAEPAADDVSTRLAGIGDGGPFAVRPLSPGQWFVVGDAPLSPAALTERASGIADVAALSDQSSGRVRIALRGPAAEAVLSRGTAVDVSRMAFPIGRSAQTLFGHIGIHLTRVGEDAFELMVLRSFATSLWEELRDLGEPHFGGS